MLRFPTRLAPALLGALLCLAACAPTASATVSVLPTATTIPTLTASPTPVLAPTPTHLPADWKVLATTYFSLAYPPDWTHDKVAADDLSVVIWAPARHSDVQVMVLPQADVKTNMMPYCQPESEGARRTTFANLPMTFRLAGPGNIVREWQFANAQQTLYVLETVNSADAATQAQDEAILATFRPDNTTPWNC